MKIVRLCLLAMVTLLVGGCSLLNTKGVPFHEMAKPTENYDMSLVYVYRVGNGRPWKTGQVTIYIDEKRIFNAVNQGFTWFYLEPGLHKMKASWPWIEKPLFEEGHFDEKLLSMEFQPGKTYYINYKIVQDRKPITSMETTSLAGKALSDTHVQSVELVSEKEAIGLRNLWATYYQSNSLK